MITEEEFLKTRKLASELVCLTCDYYDECEDVCLDPAYDEKVHLFTTLSLMTEDQRGVLWRKLKKYLDKIFIEFLLEYDEPVQLIVQPGDIKVPLIFCGFNQVWIPIDSEG